MKKPNILDAALSPVTVSMRNSFNFSSMSNTGQLIDKVGMVLKKRVSITKNDSEVDIVNKPFRPSINVKIEE